MIPRNGSQRAPAREPSKGGTLPCGGRVAAGGLRLTEVIPTSEDASTALTQGIPMK